MLGAKLRQLRREHHLTQIELAAAAGITQSYLSDLERGVEKNPSRDVIQALATALSIGVKDLVDAAWSDLNNPTAGSNPNDPMPPALVRVKQQVGYLLDERSWELVAAYAEGIAAERSRRLNESQATDSTDARVSDPKDSESE